MSADYYLKIDGIDGESTDSKHKKWIAVESFSHGVSQPVSGASSTGGQTGGRADFQNFTITKTIDSATPDLNIYCCSGKHISEIQIELCLATEEQHVFMKYVLEDVIVASVSPGGNAGSNETRPQEMVSFAYGKIKWEYTPIDNKGKAAAAVDRTWELATNKQG